MIFSSKSDFATTAAEIPHFQTLITEKAGLLRLLSPAELAKACTSLETLARACEKSPKALMDLVESLWKATRGVGIGRGDFLGFRQPDPPDQESQKPLVLQLEGDMEALWQPWVVYKRTTFLDFKSILSHQGPRATNLIIVCNDGSRSLSALLYLKDFIAGLDGLDTTQSPTLHYLEGGLGSLKEFME